MTLCCTPGRTRTFNPSIRNRMRYPLRHRGLVSATGVEPARPEGRQPLKLVRLPFRHADIETVGGGPGRNRTAFPWASTECLRHVSFRTSDLE